MNSTLITTWFLWMLEATWQASLLALLVMLVGRVTRDRLSPQARHALWLLVVARLLLPVLPASPTSLAGFSTTVQTKLLELVSDPFDASSSAESADVTLAPVPDARLRWHADREGMAASAVADQSPTRPPAKIDAPDVESLSSVHSADDVGRKVTLCRSMALIWLAGVLTCLAGGGWCWRRFRRQLQSDFRPADERLMTQLDEARKQLAMRRSVRLAVTSVVGTPAVMGLWRPTILLPPRVAAELTQAQLRLVLLHELAHLRRGDLLLGWLAAGLTAIHWFNPLLRHVFARMRQLRELACDQAVVAAIGHNQARDYGRTIVRVLELLDDFAVHRRAAPLGVTGMAFWFGRDADSIQERIRMLTNDPALPRRRRTLLAVLLVALLAAVGLTDGGEPSRPPLNMPTSPADTAPHDAAGARAANDEDDGLVTHVYEAKDVYQGINKGDKSLREYIAQWLQAATSPQGRGSFRWLDGHLILKQTPEVHERFASALKHMREAGVEQIVVDVVMMTAPEEVFQAIPADWVLQPVQSERIVQPAKSNRHSPANRSLPAEAHTVTRKELPVMLQVVADDEAKRLMNRFQSHARANVLSRPKAMTLNGQSATIATQMQRPFVVGLYNGDPQIRVIEEGTLLRLCPLMVDADTAWLDCELELPHITSVDTAEVFSRDGEQVTLQVPEVQTTRLRTSISLPLDKTLLLGGVKAHKARDGWHSLVVLVRARKVGDAAQASNNANYAEHSKTDNAAYAKTWSDIATKRAARKQEPQVLPSPPLPAPTAATPDFSATSPKPRQAATSPLMFGVGVNSDAGVSGSLVIEDDNLQTASHSRFYTTTYNVADLVVPVPSFVRIATDGQDQPQYAPACAEFAPLIKLITSTIAPASWEPSGGEGSVKPFETNLSLVISHTASVHNQVADLLGQLRKQREVQVAVELRLFQVDNRLWGGQARSMAFESLVLKPGSSTKLTESLLEDAAETSLPKITLFNHQTGEVSDPHRHIRLRIGPAIAADRRSVSLTLAVGTSDTRYALTAAGTAHVSDRGTVVWDLSDKLPKSMVRDGRIFLTATPTIVVPQEEEELLVITPPMIIGEEESLLESDAGSASAGSKRP